MLTYIRLHIGYGPILNFVAPPCEGLPIKDVGNLEVGGSEGSTFIGIEFWQNEKNTDIGVKKSLKKCRRLLWMLPYIKYARHHLLAWKPYISTPCTCTMYIAEVLVTRFQSFTFVCVQSEYRQLSTVQWNAIVPASQKF